LLGDLNMLRSFKSIKDDILLVVTDPGDVTRHSRHCTNFSILPGADSPDFDLVQGLVSLAKDFAEKPVLYYGNDEHLFVLTRNRDRLEPYFRFLMPAQDLIEDCTDKVRFLELARQKQLPTPKEINCSDYTNSREAGAKVGFPCIIKPAVHKGWLDSTVIRDAGGKPLKILFAANEQELDRWVTSIKKTDLEFIIQEFIPGGEDEIYSFHTFADENSQPLACYVGKKVRTYPSIGGVSTYVGLIHNSEIARLGNEAVKTLQVKGPVKIDFKKHARTGKYYILELNLRYNLWNYLGTVCGINLPMLAYRHLSGLHYDTPADYKTNVKWLSFGDDFRSLVRYYRPEKEYTIGSWLWSLKSPKIYDIFAWDDPLPFIINLGYYLKALATRLTGR